MKEFFWIHSLWLNCCLWIEFAPCGFLWFQQKWTPRRQVTVKQQTGALMNSKALTFLSLCVFLRISDPHRKQHKSGGLSLCWFIKGIHALTGHSIRDIYHIGVLCSRYIFLHAICRTLVDRNYHKSKKTVSGLLTITSYTALTQSVVLNLEEHNCL